jgi:hypothetical protein
VRTIGRARSDFGAPVRVDQILLPEGVGVGPDGNVYVADSGNSRVERFTPGGHFAASIGQGFPLSAGPDQLSAPEGVAIAPDGTLFVSDQRQRRVQQYAPDGAFLGGFGSQGSGDGLFQATGSLAAAPDSALYVADWSLSSVQRFTAGAFYARVGNGVGSGPGQFSHPFYLAVDCRGTLYVSDVDNDRIQRLGEPGAPSCGDPARDRSERLVLEAAARTSQRFRTTFAVAVAVACDRPCTARVAGSVRVAGRRRALRLRAQSKALDGTQPLTVRVAPSERGTDVVLGALRRHRRAVATLRVTATDLRGQRRAVTRRVRLR